MFVFSIVMKAFKLLKFSIFKKIFLYSEKVNNPLTRYFGSYHSFPAMGILLCTNLYMYSVHAM